MADHSTGNAVKVCRPATSGLELVRGLVQRCFTTGAGVHALSGQVLVVLAGSGSLGAFLAEDAELLWGYFQHFAVPLGGSSAGHSPLLNTARHSSLLLWSLNDILLESEAAFELNRLPKNGMEGIDLRALTC